MQACYAPALCPLTGSQRHIKRLFPCAAVFQVPAPRCWFPHTAAPCFHRLVLFPLLFLPVLNKSFLKFPVFQLQLLRYFHCLYIWRLLPVILHSKEIDFCLSLDKHLHTGAVPVRPLIIHFLQLLKPRLCHKVPLAHNSNLFLISV